MALEPLKYFDSLYAAETHFRDIQMIIPYLEKGLSCQIVGLPGSGKSSMFYQYAKKCLFIFNVFPELGKRF
jgi:tRNA U34 5-carboxymethylaminomethyl modifying GTPase MnmE/TrmE